MRTTIAILISLMTISAWAAPYAWVSCNLTNNTAQLQHPEYDSDSSPGKWITVTTNYDSCAAALNQLPSSAKLLSSTGAGSNPAYVAYLFSL
jgi:hypothetical protein